MLEGFSQAEQIGIERTEAARFSRFFCGGRAFIVVAVLFGLVFLAFLPATRNGFINYDDTVYVTENPYVLNGLTWENLKWALTSGHAANWHPVTWWSHMTDCGLYGLSPSGHHLTSVVLHALNAALLFLALHRMTGAAGRSLAVAVLFGLHPLRVESVAWVAERKDVLSGLFFVLTLLVYARYVQHSHAQRPRAKGFYLLTLGTFAFGLMSKPMLVTVPFLLLLLDRWPLQRIFDRGLAWRDLVREKVPFFVLAAVSSVVTFKVQEGGAAVASSLPLIARAENALVSYLRYLGKLFWPVDLAVYYPHESSWPLAGVIGCGVALAAISLAVLPLARRRPYLLVGWWWYLGMLVPVIGIVQVGTQSMADRYTYLPTIGILVAIVWGVHEVARRRTKWEAAFAAFGAALAVACAATTYRQIGRWKDSETLFQHALAVTKENSVALDNYGRALGEKGRLDEAMEQYRRSLRLNPEDPFACNGLGVLLMKKRDYDGAAQYLREALRLDPENATAHYNLGIILGRRGSIDEAIDCFERAVRLDPISAEAHNNLGGALAMKKRFDEAIPHYRDAIRLKPGHAIMHKNLGDALLATDRIDEAAAEFREAVRLQPNYAEAQEKLRAVLKLKNNAMRSGPRDSRSARRLRAARSRRCVSRVRRGNERPRRAGSR